MVYNSFLIYIEQAHPKNDMYGAVLTLTAVSKASAMHFVPSSCKCYVSDTKMFKRGHISLKILICPTRFCREKSFPATLLKFCFKTIRLKLIMAVSFGGSTRLLRVLERVLGIRVSVRIRVGIRVGNRDRVWVGQVPSPNPLQYPLQYWSWYCGLGLIKGIGLTLWLGLELGQYFLQYPFQKKETAIINSSQKFKTWLLVFFNDQAKESKHSSIWSWITILPEIYSSNVQALIVVLMWLKF